MSRNPGSRGRSRSADRLGGTPSGDKRSSSRSADRLGGTPSGNKWSDVKLWFAVLGGPTAWVLQLYVGAYLTDVFCRRGAGDSLGRVFGMSNTSFVTVLTAITAAIAALALAVSVVAYRRLKNEDRSTGGRALWMARIGILDSALFGVLIVFMFVAAARLAECAPSL